MNRQIDDAIFRNLIQLTEPTLAEGGVDTSRARDGVAAEAHGIWPLHAGVNDGPVVLLDGALLGRR